MTAHSGERGKGLRRKVRPQFWIDLDSKMRWGIECDVPSLTFDGHFVAIAAGDKDDTSETLQRIVDTLNKYHPPVKP